MQVSKSVLLGTELAPSVHPSVERLSWLALVSERSFVFSAL